MLNTAMRFMSECDSAGLKYREGRDLDDGGSLVVCGVNGKNNARYDVLYIFDKDGHNVSLRVFGLVIFPEAKWAGMLDAVNEVNGTYRWLKFFTKDDRVNVQCDAIINDDTSGKICVELLVRTMKIVDDVYPRFMRVLWG